VVHDGSAEVIEAFPVTAGSGASYKRGVRAEGEWLHAKEAGTNQIGYADGGGSAARFFYSAKASKADRAGSKHPTVKPIALMQWLARLITPPGGALLDSFAGSGTTGIAAQREGFKAVLCEREAEYVTDIRARFDATEA
jgi:site-specific DNA-methyltransferase (adenine-specific)